MVNSEGLENIAVSLGWLSHHVFSVNVEVNVLKSGLHVALAAAFVLLADLFLDKFELIGVKGAVADNVTEKLDSLGDVTLEDLETELLILSVCLAVEASTHVLNGLGNLAL